MIKKLISRIFSKSNDTKSKESKQNNDHIVDGSTPIKFSHDESPATNLDKIKLQEQQNRESRRSFDKARDEDIRNRSSRRNNRNRDRERNLPSSNSIGSFHKQHTPHTMPRSNKDPRHNTSNPYLENCKIIYKHNIHPSDISANALFVIETLQYNGFSAFVVGGAIRDLLLNKTPKDFDIATNATPTQVEKLFRKARIIGNRFQIVLIQFYGSRSDSREQESIEVTTFRAKLKKQDAVVRSAYQGQSNSAAHYGDPKYGMGEKQVEVDSKGQVWRDNVWGSHDQDASRRDFTINALYYDPVSNSIYDFYDGIKDINQKNIRIIGDAIERYKEDPARILRVARFMAKTNFKIEHNTLAAVEPCLPLLANINESRLGDELLKMLVGGYAKECIKSLKYLGIDEYILPWYGIKAKNSNAFIDLVMQKTDERISEGKSISPGFIFSAIYWPVLHETWLKLQSHYSYLESLEVAVNKVLIGLQLQRRFINDMQEIWFMQPKLERRNKSQVHKILASSKFRAGYDFLVLRSIIDDGLKEVADWWTIFQISDHITQDKMLLELKSGGSSLLSPLSSTGIDYSSDASKSKSRKRSAASTARRRARRKIYKGKDAAITNNE
jgi:poly(A) polymerase